MFRPDLKKDFLTRGDEISKGLKRKLMMEFFHGVAKRVRSLDISSYNFACSWRNKSSCLIT